MNFKNLFTESSISRMIDHNNKHDIGFISAFRDYDNCGYDENGNPCPGEDTPVKLSKKDNIKAQAALASDLRDYGITKVAGVYEEGGKSKKENTYMVVDIKDKGTLKKDLMKLGVKYKQDSVLFIPKGAIQNSRDSVLISTNNCCNNWIGKKGAIRKTSSGVFGKPNADFETRVHGRPFYLNLKEQVEFNFGSFSNAMLASKWSNEFN